MGSLSLTVDHVSCYEIWLTSYDPDFPLANTSTLHGREPWNRVVLDHNGTRKQETIPKEWLAFDSWLDVWGWSIMLRNPDRILRPLWPTFKLRKFQIDLGGWFPLLNQHNQHLYNIYLWWVNSWSQDRLSQIMRDLPPLYRINVSPFMGIMEDQQQTSKLSIITNHTSIKFQLLQITHLPHITPTIS